MGAFNRREDNNSAKMWAEWLSDESLPVGQIRSAQPKEQLSAEDVRRERIRMAGISAAPQRPERDAFEQLPEKPDAEPTETKTSINIKIKLPSIKLLKTGGLTSVLKNKKLAAPIALTLVVVLGGVFAKVRFSNKPQVAGVMTDFTVLAPKDNKGVLTNQQSRIPAPNGNEEILSFPDEFLGQPITVNQQKLPNSLRGDPDPGKKATSQLGLVDSIDTAYGRVYFTTSETQLPQTVVFVYKDNLILISSNTIREGESWKFYVESLRPL